MLQLVGGLAVARADGLLVGRSIGTRKARTLLALLGVAGSGLVTMDRIAEVLWSAAPPRSPERNVAALVSRLRATLGAGVIVGGPPGYRLAGRLSTDLHVGGASVTDAEARLAASDARTAWRSARRALDLLDRGRVLADLPDADWVDQARTDHQALLRRARHSFACAALQLGQWRRALDSAEAALGADRYDEAACRLLMHAYRAIDEPVRALLAYERLRSTLAADLGTDPAPVTQRLHVAILRCSPVRPPARNQPAYQQRDQP